MRTKPRRFPTIRETRRSASQPAKAPSSPAPTQSPTPPAPALPGSARATIPVDDLLHALGSLGVQVPPKEEPGYRLKVVQVPPPPVRTKPYSLDEAAQELGCDRSNVHKLREDGEFPNAFNVARRGSSRASWRIPVADLEAFKQRQRGRYN